MPNPAQALSVISTDRAAMGARGDVLPECIGFLSFLFQNGRITLGPRAGHVSRFARGDELFLNAGNRGFLGCDHGFQIGGMTRLVRPLRALGIDKSTGRDHRDNEQDRHGATTHRPAHHNAQIFDQPLHQSVFAER